MEIIYRDSKVRHWVDEDTNVHSWTVYCGDEEDMQYDRVGIITCDRSNRFIVNSADYDLRVETTSLDGAVSALRSYDARRQFEARRDHVPFLPPSSTGEAPFIGASLIELWPLFNEGAAYVLGLRTQEEDPEDDEPLYFKAVSTPEQPIEALLHAAFGGSWFPVGDHDFGVDYPIPGQDQSVKLPTLRHTMPAPYLAVLASTGNGRWDDNKFLITNKELEFSCGCWNIPFGERRLLEEQPEWAVRVIYDPAITGEDPDWEEKLLASYPDGRVNVEA